MTIQSVFRVLGIDNSAHIINQSNPVSSGPLVASSRDGAKSHSIGNSFSWETISWLRMWNLARPSRRRFSWKTISWKCLLSNNSNLTSTSERRAANCFLAFERHFNTSLQKKNNTISNLLNEYERASFFISKRIKAVFHIKTWLCSVVNVQTVKYFTTGWTGLWSHI